MNIIRTPALSVACLALTTLSVSTLGSTHGSSDLSTASSSNRHRADQAANVAPGRTADTKVRPAAVPGLGPTSAGSNVDPLSGMPLFSREGLRRLQVGDPLSIPTPDGDVIRYQVETRAFTEADSSQVYLRSDGRDTTYGVIVQQGPHLAGFLQRADGRAYHLVPAGDGTYRLERHRLAPGAECGVGRVEIPGGPMPRRPIARDGVAGGPGASPCPPDPAPFGVPETLRKDSGMIIDVLFVFTQDAALRASAEGRDVRALASLAIAQANLALRRSSEQPLTAFDGRTGERDNILNDRCGYASGGWPATGNCEFQGALGEGMAGTCKDQDTPPQDRRTVHATLPGVAPAEGDTCTPRVRLVAALVADGFFGQESPYNSTGLPLDLARVQNPFDGYLDYVPLWRDALGADAVCLVGQNYGSDSGFIGLAYVMNDANSPAHSLYEPPGYPGGRMALTAVGNPHPLVDLTQLTPDPATVPPGAAPFDGGNAGLPLDQTISTLQVFEDRAYSLLDYEAIAGLTYAHELGHNFGCQHNHSNGSPTRDALFPDSFGYRTQGGGGGQEGFKTVMSYGGQTQLPGFSNPNKSWADYGAPNNFPFWPDSDAPVDPAGIAFDFACTELDGDGTDVSYVRATGINVAGCTAPPHGPDQRCENETDEDRTTSDPAPMVVATDVRVDQQLNTDQSGAANNARSISQVKFDFARFRCSLFPVVDCNDDLVDDFVQAVDGTLADCNGNGIPDSCETTPDPGSGNPSDCNGNGVPDECDINSGESSDDNANLIPDECEDSTLLFTETFERVPFGFVEGALPIARLSVDALEQVRSIDPDFPEYFATIETVGLAQAPGNGGYVYFNVTPSAFEYRLGGNGRREFCPNDPRSATSGRALAFGSRAYGQALNFDSSTGDFPSQAGITRIRTARDCKEIRLRINAADFTGYFDYQPPLPLINNYPYLEENLVFISAFNEAEELVYEVSLDLRGQWTGSCLQNPNPQGFEFLRIGAPLGSDVELSIRTVEIRGAFVVLDNISFDAGLDNSAYPCVADIAGGPLDPIGIPSPDGRVGGEDLLVVLAAYGWGLSGFPQFTTCPPDAVTLGEELARLADINDDCQVDSMDLLEVLAAWGQCLGGTP